MNSSETKTVEEVDNSALLALAKKHGMNTGVRRSIFIVDDK